MKCDNCGKNNANIRYFRNVNGVKEKMNLCEECAQKLGITDIGFNMPIDFSSFLGGFWEDFTNSDILPLIGEKQELKCKGCNSTFEDIINTGKFGCPECYETFEDEIDEIMNKIHGKNRHIGRLGKIEQIKVDKNKEDKKIIENTENNDELSKLKSKLKELVKEENYEEAAKVRDQIKELENK